MSKEFSASDDTASSVRHRIFMELRRMEPTERMRRFFNLCAAARKFTDAGIHLRYPNCSEDEFRKRKAAILLGREYAMKNYNWDPELEGY